MPGAAPPADDRHGPDRRRDRASRHPVARRRLRQRARTAAAARRPAPVRAHIALERAAARRRAARPAVDRVRRGPAQPGLAVRGVDQHRPLQHAGLHGARRPADDARRARRVRPRAPAGLRRRSDPERRDARGGQRRADGRVAALDRHDVGVLARVPAARHVARELGRTDHRRLDERGLLQLELGRDRDEPARPRRPDAHRRAAVRDDRPRARDGDPGRSGARVRVAGAAHRRDGRQHDRDPGGHALPDRPVAGPQHAADGAGRARDGAGRAALRDRRARPRRQRRVLRRGPHADRLESLHGARWPLRRPLAGAAAGAVPVGPPRGAAQRRAHRVVRHGPSSGASRRCSSATFPRRS
jgi:hypothetical protein